MSIYKGYVVNDRGEYYVQIPDEGSQWGFYLAHAVGESSRTYDGGFGCDHDWIKVVPLDQVPADVREEMDWLLEGES